MSRRSLVFLIAIAASGATVAEVRGGVDQAVRSGRQRPGSDTADSRRITVTCITTMNLIRQAYVLFAEGAMNLAPETIVPMAKSPAWVDSD